MHSEPGFVRSLREDISKVDREIRDWIVDKPEGLPGDNLISLVWRPTNDNVDVPDDLDGREITHLNEIDIRYQVTGIEALERGETALCLLVSEEDEHSDQFFEVLTAMGVKHVWFFCHWDFMSERMKSLIVGHPTLSGFMSYALTPDNRLIFRPDGNPELYQLGSGDVIPALRGSKVFKEFAANGGRDVAFVKPETSMAALRALIGQHLMTKAQFTCEVTRRTKGDPRCVVAWNKGNLEAILPGRLEGCDPDDFSWSTTGTCVLHTKTLEKDPLHEFAFRRRRVIKDKRVIVEHKRSLLELTEHRQSHFVSITEE